MTEERDTYFSVMMTQDSSIKGFMTNIDIHVYYLKFITN